MDIWKEAPEGATHYNAVSDEFMRIENNQWVAWIKGDWEWVIPSAEQRLKIVKRPQAMTAEQDKPQEWKDGLPLRDAKIEVYGGVYGSNEMRWKESVAYAIIDGRVLAESTSHSGEYVLYTAKEVRPIKSQAEKEREEFALEMCKDSGMFGYGENLTAQDAREIYDWLKSTGRLDTKGDV